MRGGAGTRELRVSLGAYPKGRTAGRVRVLGAESQEGGLGKGGEREELKSGAVRSGQRKRPKGAGSEGGAST